MSPFFFIFVNIKLNLIFSNFPPYSKISNLIDEYKHFFDFERFEIYRTKRRKRRDGNGQFYPVLSITNPWGGAATWFRGKSEFSSIVGENN